MSLFGCVSACEVLVYVVDVFAEGGVCVLRGHDDCSLHDLGDGWGLACSPSAPSVMHWDRLCPLPSRERGFGRLFWLVVGPRPVDTALKPV